MIKKTLYVFRVLYQRGVGFLFYYFFESYLFDLKHGTKTSSRVTKDVQNILSTKFERENGLLYVASFTSVTRKTVSLAKIILGNERFGRSQFVDLGCGKGKALLVHALCFGQDHNQPSIGIEYDSDLSIVARNNIKKCGIPEDTVKVITDSAVNFKHHISSKELVVYLYNSFRGETLKNVLKKLSSFPHILIYVDPAERVLLPDYGYTLHYEQTGKYNADTWLIASANL